MRKTLIIAAAVVAAVLLAITITVLAVRPAAVPSASPSPSSSAETGDHVLEEGGEVVLVEFLDPECPACAAFHPVVQELRAEFGDRMTYAVRFFPLQQHPNAVTASVAAEAAGQQDAFEPMLDLLFERQADWAGSQESQLPLFREYAAELGLDLAVWDAAVADEATLQAVADDAAAGAALGVRSTPTFLLDGRMLELTSYDDLRDTVAEALGE
ncbi:MAG TPA: thioredoxin domain-containing protein [Rhodoglobus sp.]|nr:thioredoxin domain-containing protein [Rhodoglobus sp.]